jgi:hypothetical protein
MWMNSATMNSAGEPIRSATSGAAKTNAPLRMCMTPSTFCTGKNRSAIRPRKNGATIDPTGLAR